MKGLLLLLLAVPLKAGVRSSSILGNGITSLTGPVTATGPGAAATTVSITTANIGAGFNGASQLLQVGSDGKLPVIDGSNLTGISGILSGGQVGVSAYWTASNQLGNGNDNVTTTSDTFKGSSGVLITGPLKQQGTGGLTISTNSTATTALGTDSSGRTFLGLNSAASASKLSIAALDNANMFFEASASSTTSNVGWIQYLNANGADSNFKDWFLYEQQTPKTGNVLQVNGNNKNVSVFAGLQLFSATIATINGITPTAVGETYYCSNCSPAKIVVATGTSAGNFADAAGGTFK